MKIFTIKNPEAIFRKQWYALYTLTGCEKKVIYLLGKKGIRHYCPLDSIAINGRNCKKVFKPFLNSIVFILVSENELVKIKALPGVLNFVYWLKQPAVFRDMKIEIIRHFLQKNVAFQLMKSPENIAGMIRVIVDVLMEQESTKPSYLKNNLRIASLRYDATAQSGNGSSL